MAIKRRKMTLEQFKKIKWTFNSHMQTPELHVSIYKAEYNGHKLTAIIYTPYATQGEPCGRRRTEYTLDGKLYRSSRMLMKQL